MDVLERERGLERERLRSGEREAAWDEADLARDEHTVVDLHSSPSVSDVDA